MNPYLDIILRSASVYLFMLIALRIFGKKELSQLNTADVILILLISNSVQNAMVGSDTSLLGGLAAAAILFVINFTLKKLMFKFPKFSDFFARKTRNTDSRRQTRFQVIKQIKHHFRRTSGSHPRTRGRTFFGRKIGYVGNRRQYQHHFWRKKPSPNALQKVETKQKNNGIIVFNFNKREKSN